MSDLERELRDLGEHLDPGWDQARVELGLSSLHARRRRRRIIRAGASGLASAVVLLALGAIALRTGESTVDAPGDAPAEIAAAPAPVEAPPATERALEFGDGSRAILLTADTKLVTHRVADDEIVLNLEAAGAARFEVIPSAERAFVVHASRVRVEVKGTAFTVRHLEDSVNVEVHRGRVEVTPGEEERVVLTSGQTLTVALGFISERALSPESPKTEAPRKIRVAKPAAKPSGKPGLSEAPAPWQELAEQGDYTAAFEALAQEEPRVRSPEDSLAAADVARLSGHPEQTLHHLQSVVDNFPDDPRAALAAFTLGRVLLRDLGEARRAAEAFAHAQVLRPDGSLVEDALAREVEAWFKAREPALAKKRAAEYLSRYPDGKRRDSVLRYGAPDG